VILIFHQVFLSNLSQLNRSGFRPFGWLISNFRVKAREGERMSNRQVGALLLIIHAQNFASQQDHTQHDQQDCKDRLTVAKAVSTLIELR